MKRGQKGTKKGPKGTTEGPKRYQNSEKRRRARTFWSLLVPFWYLFGPFWPLFGPFLVPLISIFDVTIYLVKSLSLGQPPRCETHFTPVTSLEPRLCSRAQRQVGLEGGWKTYAPARSPIRARNGAIAPSGQKISRCAAHCRACSAHRRHRTASFCPEPLA